MAYGAGAIQVLKAGQNGVMVAFVPPDIKFVPLTEAINKVRTVPADSEFTEDRPVARHLPWDAFMNGTITECRAIKGSSLDRQQIDEQEDYP